MLEKFFDGNRGKKNKEISGCWCGQFYLKHLCLCFMHYLFGFSLHLFLLCHFNWSIFCCTKRIYLPSGMKRHCLSFIYFLSFFLPFFQWSVMVFFKQKLLFYREMHFCQSTNKSAQNFLMWKRTFYILTKSTH